jgi:hypothetical protein
MGERVPDGITPPQSGRPGESALEDYAALEAVLSATPRGRWFLSEYARQNRRAETGMLLGAMSKLEAAVLAEQNQAALREVFAELTEISEAIARIRCEIADADAAAVGKLTDELCLIERRVKILIEVWNARDSAVEDPQAA